MIAFLGDVFLTRPVKVEAELPGSVVCNLEAPLTMRTNGYPGKINLRTDPRHFDETFPQAPIAVCLANNHVMDYGEDGLADTIEHLERRGIRWFGVGTEADAFHNPLRLAYDGFDIAMLGYVCPSATPVFARDGRPGVAPLSLERVAADVEAAKRAGARRVVVHLHWGAEQVHLPAPGDVTRARAIADAGADLVIGHHAHCVQPFEIHHGKPIFYGLGNAIFPAHRSPSYFDTNGMSQGLKVTRSFPWNRKSLAVTWNPTSNRVTVRALAFDGASLRSAAGLPRAARLEVGTDAAYAAQYRRSYRWGKLRHTLAGYLAAPKLPRWSHVVTLRRMLVDRAHR
ncbi:MAG: CapA family protein [Trueperaceae bacterium]